MTNPDYLISTPENVDLHLELGGLGNRVYAGFIDITIKALIIISLIFLAVGGSAVLDQLPLPESSRSYLGLIAVGILCLVILCVAFGYHILFEGLWRGQTPGKKLAGIRVIDQNGQPVSWASVWIRNLIGALDVSLVFIGLLVIWIDPHERRLGDLAAGTLVIRERLPEGQAQIKLTTEAPDATFVDVGRITPHEYDLLVSFLRRRDQMSRSQRPLVARKLASHFENKLDSPRSSESYEPFLEQIYQAYRARAGESSDR